MHRRVLVVLARGTEIAMMHPARRVRARVLHELGEARDEGCGHLPGGTLRRLSVRHLGQAITRFA